MKTIKTNNETNNEAIKLAIKVAGNFASGNAEIGKTYKTVGSIEFYVTIEANPYHKGRNRYYINADHDTYPHDLGKDARCNDKRYQWCCKFINEANAILCDYPF